MEIEIIIGSHNEFFNDVKGSLKEFKEKKGTSKKDRLYFESIEDLHKCISPKRVELMKTIRREKPNSVYRLAKLTSRDFEAVKKDLKVLESSKLISFERMKKGRKNKIPRCNVKKITIPI